MFKMLELYKTGIGIAAGVAGTIFIGYCIYFDQKRRKDPEYRKKVRERRRERNQKSGGARQNGMPNLNDHQAIEKYFLQEIQLGETQIARGDFESGVEHLANAIVVCGQPARLLQVLQTSLPHQVFAMLIVKMQEFGDRAQKESKDGPKIITGLTGDDLGSSPGAILIDDLE